jgi:hypothetical protein
MSKNNGAWRTAAPKRLMPQSTLSQAGRWCAKISKFPHITVPIPRVEPTPSPNATPSKTISKSFTLYANPLPLRAS